MNVVMTADIRYRCAVGARVLAAVVGGYLLAAALKLLLTLLAPIEPAGMFANLSIYAIHTGILLWVFHARSATRAWILLLLWTVLAYAACWLLGARP